MRDGTCDGARLMATTAELFSVQWATALGDALAANDSFRTAARGWNSAVILEWSDASSHPRSDDVVCTDEVQGCGVYLLLHDGECHSARMATATDYATARYVLSATLAVWHEMLSGHLAPTMAMLRGKLKLTKGSVADLMPHVKAAHALVRVAAEIELGLLSASVERPATAEPA